MEKLRFYSNSLWFIWGRYVRKLVFIEAYMECFNSSFGFAFIDWVHSLFGVVAGVPVLFFEAKRILQIFAGSQVSKTENEVNLFRVFQLLQN